MIENTAAILKALGEPTRLRIVRFLALQELCVCELEAILSISQPRVSQHLKVLKQAGVIQERKEKQRSYFSLSPTFLDGSAISAFSYLLKANLEQIPGLKEESKRFAELNSNDIVKACKEGCSASDPMELTS